MFGTTGYLLSHKSGIQVIQLKALLSLVEAVVNYNYTCFIQESLV